MLSIAGIRLGAALGALLRWALGLFLNALFAPIPLGTLAANILGGFLMGIAMASFASSADLSPAWRLFIVTGFLGGLTTFSAFSAEVTVHLQAQNFGWAAAVVGAHVVGSVFATLLGFTTSAWLLARFGATS